MPERSSAREIIGDAPVIEPAAFERIRRVGGERLLQQMIAAFLEHSPERLTAALNADHAAEVARAAHSLKSSAGNLGLGRVMRIAEAMEVREMQGDARGCLTLRPALAAAFEEACSALRRETERVDQ